MNKHKHIHSLRMDTKLNLWRVGSLIIDQKLRIDPINIINILLLILDGSLVEQYNTDKVIEFYILIVLDVYEDVFR